MRRRLLSLLLGFLVTLALFEIGLRALGAFERYTWNVEGTKTTGDKPVILFVGNSHTMGFGAPKGRSFPDQFQERLAKSSPNGESPFEIVNVGRGNANSTFVKEHLPDFLEKFRPRYVVLMTGETNYWNHYGFAKFAQLFVITLEIS